MNHNLKDDYQHKGMRRRLVQELREKGIRDAAVLAAIEKIPRHLFLDSSFLKHAYEDKAFPIGAGQTISQPYTVAFQSQLLQIDRGEKVLEIGTGSGYQTSVLYELGAKVYSIERQKALFDKTKHLIQQLGVKANLYYGDGYAGLPQQAPFDKIIVTCGGTFVPAALKEQLVIGGILVIPVGDEKVQRMFSLIKTGPETFETIEHGDFKFVPFLQQKV